MGFRPWNIAESFLSKRTQKAEHISRGFSSVEISAHEVSQVECANIAALITPETFDESHELFLLYTV